MSGTLILCIGLAYFVAAYFGYGGYLRRVFAVDPKNPVPARTEYDGVDYVPTPRIVLFGHHFASIAGPGPIVGPIMAAYFGWLPALLWILLGCVFVGALHDLAALVISVRNRGRSISFVMERMMGFTGRQLFSLFCFCCLVLIVAIFTLMIANIFVSVPAVATASLLFILMAPLFAVVTRRLKVPLLYASIVFVPLVFLTVAVGHEFPIDLRAWYGWTDGQTELFWLWVLAAYVFLASVIPVQWLLQPRDYLNSWLLYATLLLSIAGIMAYNPEIKLSYFNGWEAVTASGNMTALVPALFIYIACGACSGFHALVASGTTSKQLASERDLLPIGYGAMLVEGVLGVIALIAVMSMEPDVFFELGKNPAKAFASGISNFATALGIDAAYAGIFLSLAIAAFMMTSLDTATRLGRFLAQELFMPRAAREDASQGVSRSPLAPWRRLMTNKLVASVLIVGLAMIMALSGSAGTIWPIFGASNQLMAALTFLAITLWLLNRRANWIIAFVPMILMMVMSLWGVMQVVAQQWGHNLVLVSAGVFLTVMAVLMILLGLSIIVHRLREHYTTAHPGMRPA